MTRDKLRCSHVFFDASPSFATAFANTSCEHQDRSRILGRIIATMFVHPSMTQSEEALRPDLVVDSFDDLDLQEGLLRGIYSYGFEKPSAIQQRAIRPVIAGRDTIGQAQSGTGKTATCVVGALQRIDYGHRACQALILAPTRELANQIFKVVLALGDRQDGRFALNSKARSHWECGA